MRPNPLFNIVLVHPEIPGNTGSIGRTSVALNARLHLIHPLGFDLSEKAVRRAGLDYWKHVDIHEYSCWEEFLKKNKPKSLIYFSRFSQDKVYFDAPYIKGSYLVFGSETKGLPESLIEKEKSYALPQFSEEIRSLNLSNVVTAASYECLRQIFYSK